MIKMLNRPSAMLGLIVFVIVATLVAVANPASRQAFAAVLEGAFTIPQPAAATAMPEIDEPIEQPSQPAPTLPKTGNEVAVLGEDSITLSWETTSWEDCNWHLVFRGKRDWVFSGYHDGPCNLEEITKWLEQKIDMVRGTILVTKTQRLLLEQLLQRLLTMR